MTRRTFDDPRDAPVAAVTQGPAPGFPISSAGSHVELPAVLVGALEATGTSIEGFLDRLRQGSIWQDQAIRASAGEIVIQASLAQNELRAVVQIGRSTWYHYPIDVLHLLGVVLPATTMAIGDVPLKTILRHPLLDPLPVRVRAIRDLNTARPSLGVSIHLHVSTLTVSVSPDTRRRGLAFAAPNPGK